VLEPGVRPFGASKVLVEVLELAGPELGLNAAETALGPLGGDEHIDERKLSGIGRLMMLKECGLKGIELGGVFAANDLREGVDVRLESILRTDGFDILRISCGNGAGPTSR
jgi:hypothetical protein